MTGKENGGVEGKEVGGIISFCRGGGCSRTWLVMLSSSPYAHLSTNIAIFGIILTTYPFVRPPAPTGTDSERPTQANVVP